MSEQRSTFDEMLTLAERQCNAALSADDIARLERLLADDVPLRRDYLRYRFLHAHLASTDEVVGQLHNEDQLRELTDHSELQAFLAEAPQLVGGSLLRKDRSTGGVRQSLVRLLPAVTAASGLLALILVLLYFVNPPNAVFDSMSTIAEITQTSNARWGDAQPAYEVGQRLGPGTMRLRSGQAGLKFHDGAEILLHGKTTFGLESEKFASLFKGKILARLEQQDQQFTLQAAAVRVIDRGTEFGVEINEDGTTEVHCFDGEVETQSQVRLPMIYWNFDQADAKVIDVIAGQIAKVSRGARPVEGLVGSGAMAFDNTREAQVNVGHGGGTQVGTGRFGVTSGLTIEALAVVRWSGDGSSNGNPSDYDEIFRKEDGSKRMLLCFQNDAGANQRNVPAMEKFGPTLSFGLYLAGDGYSELEARLDGTQGPLLDSLRDEKPHHFVATYDSWTGVKALYIDGVQVQSAKFATGTLIESGGPTPAIIGNTASGGEPFHGVIDEVAIYNMALSPSEVAQHWQYVQVGRNYFGTDSSSEIGGRLWRSTRILTAGNAMQFDSTTGLPLKTVTVDRGRFNFK